MFSFSFNKTADRFFGRYRFIPASVQSLTRGIGRLGLCGALGGLALAFFSQTANAAKPEIDLTYYNGQIYYMIGPKMITNPSPKLLAQAEELYMVAYPINPDGRTDLGPMTLPSGYQPTCNPCFRPGMMPQFGYHDHIVGGVPGMGKNGTAGVYEGPWKVILLMYKKDVASDPNFTPITSVAALDAAEAAEAAGAPGEFMPINQDLKKGPNPYEIQTGKVLICPLVSPHA